MYEYNNAAGGYSQQPNFQIPNQTVPNVMMDDTQGYGAQSGTALEFGQVTVVPNGTTEIPTYVGMVQETPQFDIPDAMLRRTFVRKLYAILLMQNILAIPVVEIFLLCFDGPIDGTIYFSFWTLRLILYALMYVFSDFRRYAPVNKIVLSSVTMMQAIGEGIYANAVGNQTAVLSPLVVIFQLIILMAYSRQTRFKFDNFNAVSLMLVIFLICALIFELLLPMYVIHIGITSAVSTCYFVYDTQLMLTGFHGYNLKPEEHVFAAINIYADFPYLLWRLFRYIFIDSFIRVFNFLRNCCFSEVC